jgi:hypothetical protein
MTEEQRKAAKELKQKEKKAKSNAPVTFVIENPRAINPANKLQMSLVKYAQQQKDAVSDMFSKNTDPIDIYLQLKERADAL